MIGAWPLKNGVEFHVWAPQARTVDLVLEDGRGSSHPLQRTDQGFFQGIIPSARPGSLYRYRIDGQGPFPDPASRFQPQGVHGPSQVIDLQLFAWSDSNWRGVDLKHLIVYELHVGTFTAKGTFDSLIERLPYLVDLGVTAIELMPIADFPGNRNWGYDGVSLFAPSHTYGQPDELQQLMNKAHQAGLAVLLDVVYNHLGPDGNYLGAYSPFYFTSHHHTPWGPAVNLDAEHAEHVRGFFIENALHWIREYHFDGLRLDATHAMIDESHRHFLAELTARVHASVTDRQVLLIAEDCRNLDHMIKPEKEGGWGLDAVWSDDFHHEVRRSLAGDHEGYYQDFSGTMADLCATIQRGWFFCGQRAEHFGRPRGTDPAGIPLERFIFFIQNHDQIGNRAFGERLNHQIAAANYRAASVLLLSIPETPMLFMGQEWGASAPFLFFTNHHGELGAAVTEGRRSEFKAFSIFADPSAREKIPDPQNQDTFERSHLNWKELNAEAHASLHRFYEAMIRWRLSELVPMNIRPEDFTASPLSDKALALEYRLAGQPRYRVIVQWQSEGRHDLTTGVAERWETIVSSEDKRFFSETLPIEISRSGSNLTLQFKRPGAVILKRMP